MLNAAPSKFSESTIIISCEQDKSKYIPPIPPFLSLFINQIDFWQIRVGNLVKKSFVIYSVELILGGTLRQELELDDHILLSP